jgi:hypothetical protein
MAAGAWVVHDKHKEHLGIQLVNMDTDTFYVRLYTTGSNIATASLNDATTATNEVSGANGYATGGVAISFTSWTESAGTVTFDMPDPYWDATTAGITAYYAAIIDTTTTPYSVVAHCLLDATTPGSVTTSAGNRLTIQIATGGVYTLA